MKKILIVDDEEVIRDLIVYNLEKEGYETMTAANGKEAIAVVNSTDLDLILLDVMMPEMDGIEFCSQLRSNPKNDHIVVCFLTARSEDYSQIAGLEAGADDYISKPVKPRVLLSRIKALLRRTDARSTSGDQDLNGLIINREEYQVTLNGERVHLPKKEFELLALLASKPGSVFERDTILETVWGSDIIVGDRTIDVHVRKLREKLGDGLIKTVKGVGYKLEV
jgi:two-component system, OmpR family, alkaline phosphatase synthesis response regulator PhoP